MFVPNYTNQTWGNPNINNSVQVRLARILISNTSSMGLMSHRIQLENAVTLQSLDSIRAKIHQNVSEYYQYHVLQTNPKVPK